MSKSSGNVNYMDLIMNPDKHGLGGSKNPPPPAQPRSGALPKEAVIPQNLLGAKKNEWQEMRNQNSSIRSTDSDKQKEQQKDRNQPAGRGIADPAKNVEKKQSELRDSHGKSQQQIASNNDSVSKRQVPEEVSGAAGISQKQGLTKEVSETVSKQERLRAQYSLKEESKQDYKRIFSEVVKEYRNDENFFFDANQTRGMTYVLCVLIVILSAMVFFDYKSMSTPKFCVTGLNGEAEKSGDCWVCPLNADCKRSVMRCKEGFVQTKNFTCDVNPKLITSAENFIVEKLLAIQQNLGDQICFSEADRNDKFLYIITLDELFDEVTNRIQDQTSINEQKDILSRFIMNSVNQATYGFTYNAVEKQLTSQKVRLSLFCQGKLLVNANKTACQVAGVTFVVLAIIAKLVLSRVRQERIAKQIYEELEREIQESAENSINVSYYKEGIVNKYKNEFNERIWMLVDQRRFDQKKINVFRDYDGLYWSLA